MFPGIAYEKPKTGIVTVLRIGHKKDPAFTQSMTVIRKCAWESLVSAVQEFLGNRKPQDSQEVIESVYFRKTHLKFLKIWDMLEMSRVIAPRHQNYGRNISLFLGLRTVV